MATPPLDHNSQLINQCIQRQLYVDAFLKPVILQNFSPSGLSLDIMQIVSTCLDTKPVLIGGALRDEFRGETPKDYDIHISLRDTFEKDGIDDATHQDQLLNRMIKTLLSTKEFSHFESDPAPSFRTKKYVDVKMQYGGARVDVVFSKSSNPSLQAQAMDGEAILNSIAMDHNGIVMCHPFFADDILNETYTIRVENQEAIGRALARYQKKTDRFGHFTLVKPDEYKMLLDGMEMIDA